MLIWCVDLKLFWVQIRSNVQRSFENNYDFSQTLISERSLFKETLFSQYGNFLPPPEFNRITEGQTHKNKILIVSLFIFLYPVLFGNLSNYLTGHKLFPTMLHIPINSDLLDFVSCYGNTVRRQAGLWAALNTSPVF